MLFAGVVSRFRPEVLTQKLRAARIDDNDYATLRAGMTRCSKFSGHDSALGAPPDLPKIDEIAADIQSLEAFANAATTRRRDLDKKYGEREKEPVEAKTLQ